MDLFEQQYKLEREMVQLGEDRYRKEKQRAYERGMAADAPPQRMLTVAVVPVLADAVRKFTAKKGPGRHAIAAKLLRDFDPEVVAMITLRRLLDISFGDRFLSKEAGRVGNALMLERRLEALIAQDKDFYDTILRQFKTEHREHRARAFGHHLKEIPKPWTYEEVLRVGMACIALVVDHTGLFALHRANGRHKKYHEVRPTERLMAWMRDKDAKLEGMAPFWLPTVVPPKDWDDEGRGGGYYFVPEALNHGPLGLRGGHPGPVSPHVVEALNEVQRTAWSINEPVLDVLKHAWEHSQNIGSVPGREEIPLPKCPVCGGHVAPKSEGGHACLEDEKARKEYRIASAKVWAERVSMTDRRLQVMHTLAVADRMQKYERFYYPYKMDFRGRMYPVPSHLQPQGPDYARALLKFAEGKRINDERALGWLMIHGANLWGNDKVPLEERIRWVEENNAEITRSGLDPYGCRFWTEADKPWQFLAFCLEFVAFKKVGYAFVSHLPITVDGSCNGLQHFSAMLRDEVGGAAVNLVPSDKPADVYQQVADVVVGRLIPLAYRNWGPPDFEETKMAAKWLEFGITRKTVKRSVMIVPYSGTQRACRRYIEEHIRERGDHPFEDEFKASVFLSKHVWAAIEEVIKSSREVMGWLRACSRVHARTHKPLVWVNPIGFPMVQFYEDWSAHKLETRFGEKIARLVIDYKKENGKVRPLRQMNGISPNFIHSLDACALMYTVLYGKDNGITSWTMIHDCYGTHAADMDVLSACLREAFVDLYKEHDPLQSFHEQILQQIPEADHKDVPPPPAKGKLVLGMVRHSDFFFA